MPDYFLFLQSSRFHALVLAALVLYFVSIGSLGDELGNSLLAILLGHIGIRTIDRHGEE